VDDVGVSAHTDAAGAFELTGIAAPCRLLAAKAGFTAAVVDVAAGSEPTIVLTLLVGLNEEIRVAGSMPTDRPVWVAAGIVDPVEATPDARHVTDALSIIPGVADNGQGGLFQVSSIRGMSARRQLTLVSGVRIEGFRRAGVALSFIDPTLLREIEVVRGPMSASYGSGALSGVLEVEPLSTDHWSAGAGFDSRGDETALHVNGGWARGSFALAHRQAGNSTDAEGKELNTHFEQLSGIGDVGWELGRHELRALMVFSRGDDIGKDNIDFPARSTEYPEERHGILKLNLGAASWSARVYAHDNDVVTRVDDRGVLHELINEATDSGAAVAKDIGGRGRTSARLGVELFARRGVSALEREAVVATPSGSAGPTIAETLTLDDGSHQEAGGFATGRASVGRTSFEMGARATWLEQSNGAARNVTVTENAFDAIAGGVTRIADATDLYYGLSSGCRFPDLGERFFTGTTPRGSVIGVPTLEPERAWSAEIGVRYHRGVVTASGHLFRNEVRDYIEQVDLADDVSTFRNLTEGTVEGVEVEGRWAPNERFNLQWSAHVLQGADDDGARLADVPADRMRLTASHRSGRWTNDATFEHRWAENDVGSGEKPVQSAELVSLRVRYETRRAVGFSLYGRNLLDRSYWNTADRKSSLAPGRSFGAVITWNQ
jgi:iron complex outermembrane receptor protein